VTCAARTLGFLLDGSPDGRQWLWLTLEIVIAVGCAIGLRVYLRKRSAQT
jgi:hypothetical protein